MTFQADIRRPIGAAIFNGKTVTLTGPQGFINEWSAYFKTSGWQSHVESGEPFVSMKQNSSMANFVAYKSGDGKDQYETALTALGTDVKTTEIAN